MRKTILFFVFLTGFFLSEAQPYQDKIEYNKQKQACMAMNYNYPPEAVENALISKLIKLGYIGKEEKGLFNKDKGFRVYKETTLGEVSSDKYDYVINVQRKSARKSDETTLYILVLKDDVNALSKLSSEEVGKLKSFLSNLQPEVEDAHLEILISAQVAAIGKAEKKYKTLLEDSVQIQNKIKKLQEELNTNLKEQETQRKEIENQHKALDALKGRRKVSA
jgi:hypothetical protein